MAKEQEKNQKLETENTEPEIVESEEAEPSEDENTEPETNESPEMNEAGQDAETFDVAEFRKLKEKFGSEIASDLVCDGKGEAEGYRLQAEQAKAEAEALRKENEALKSAEIKGGAPAKASHEKNNKKSIWG